MGPANDYQYWYKSGDIGQLLGLYHLTGHGRPDAVRQLGFVPAHNRDIKRLALGSNC
jgi:hypothetical protein